MIIVNDNKSQKLDKKYIGHLFSSIIYLEAKLKVFLDLVLCDPKEKDIQKVLQKNNNPILDYELSYFKRNKNFILDKIN